MSRNQPPDGQLSFSILADLTPRGDGTYILKPRPVDSDLDTWLSVRDAGRMMANMSPQTVRALVESGHLISRRPSKRKTQISLKSIRAHMEKTGSDPAFWDKKKT
jgi:hypothetical protein